MGNHSSCLHLRGPRSSKSATVLDARGDVRRRVSLPVTAAELMLEEPLHVVAALEEIRRGRRVVPLRADDELAAGQAYLLFPSKRANGKVTEAEVAAIDAACRRRPLRLRGGVSKVSPATGSGEGLEMKEEDGLGKCLGGGDGGLTGQRLGCCRRYWRPVLDTISEVA